jgi:hypothetical protein
MKARPSYIWFVPILLFSLSTARWVAFIGLFAYFGELEWPRDYFGVTHIYLPLLASLVGLSAAIVAARVFWRSVLQTNLWALAIYSLTFLSWGIVDIHYFHYQVFHCGIYGGVSWEDYWTWWFIPQALVPR